MLKEIDGERITLKSEIPTILHQNQTIKLFFCINSSLEIA